jgi:hypothetical protein
MPPQLCFSYIPTLQLPPIEQCKETLKEELLAYLAQGQSDKVILDPLEGLCFVGLYHKKKGKVIRIHAPSSECRSNSQHTSEKLNVHPI